MLSRLLIVLGFQLEHIHFCSVFQIAATRAFVPSSITISSGQGRVNPSVAHFRVASIPIFDP